MRVRDILKSLKKRVENFGANVGALLSPETRADFLRGFVPQTLPPTKLVGYKLRHTPVPQPLQKPADVLLGLGTGLTRGMAGFTGAETALQKRLGLSPLYKPQSRLGRAAEFAGGLAGFALGPGKFIAPLEAGVQTRLGTTALSRLSPLARRVALGVAAETASSVPLAGVETVATGKPLRETIPTQLGLGLGGRAAFGGLAMTAPLFMGGIKKVGSEALEKALKNIPKELRPLAREVRKYKSVEEFRKAFTQAHLTDLSDPIRHRWGRAISPYKGEPYVDISDLLKDKSILETIKYDNPNIYKIITSKKNKIKIYRAVPKNVGDEIRIGDYVYLYKKSAIGHGEQVLKGEQGVDYKILEKEVPKSDVVWGEADFSEWAYSPKKIREFAPSLEEFYHLVTKQLKPAEVAPKIKIKTEAPIKVRTQEAVLDQPLVKTEALKGKQQSVLSKVSEEEKQSFEHIIRQSLGDVKKKVNILDYLRTPKYVLEKIGLKKEAEALDRAYEKYKLHLRDEMDRISRWREKAPSPESARRIFKWLDGQDVQLTKQEQQVANEIREYLKDWADKLKLPEDKRITHYITHIFEKDFIQKEFDPELAKIIADKPAGSVYDPFLQKRLGKKGYIEDVWRALNAYVKRAIRKYNMDPALEMLKKATKDQPLENYNYIKRLTHGVNMRPTEFENLTDNLIKSIVGYRFGQRPTNLITRIIRQHIYRGALGLNIGSAVRNLTQLTNTYAELGDKYTVVGAFNFIRKGLRELYENGVLDDGLIEDKSIPIYKNIFRKIDDALFTFFDAAEKINRGVTYYGAKAKALAKGMSEEEAINYAKNVVAKTQFKFGGVHTPVALQSDIAKTLAQFQTFSLKQAEFLSSKIKNKEFTGLLRFMGANLALYGLIGKALGWRPEEMLIPSFRFSSPTTDILSSFKDYVMADTPQEKARAERKFLRTSRLLVPAGVQLGKTYEGLKDVMRGASITPSGRMRYTIKPTTKTAVMAGLFGKYAIPEARQYYDVRDEKAKIKKSIEKPGLLDKIKGLLGEDMDPVTKYAIAYGYDKYFTPPAPYEGKLKQIKFERNKLNAAVRLLDDDRIPDEVKPKLIQQLGYKPEDIEYESLTRLRVADRVEYLASELKDLSPQQRVALLAQLAQKESLTGRKLVTRDVLKGLRKRGLISENDYSTLRRKRGRKARIKVGTTPKLRLPQPKPVRPTIGRFKIKAPKLPQITRGRVGVNPALSSREYRRLRQMIK